MKPKLLMACVAMVFAGCATYTGGVADDDGVIFGADGTVYSAETGAVIAYPNPERDMFGAPRPPRAHFTHLHLSPMANPIYKQPSPSGNDMGGIRPEFNTYWDYYYWR